MDDLRDLQDMLLKDAQGVGVGEHEAGGVRPRSGAQGLHIHTPVGGGGDVYHRVPHHGRRGRVGAVGGVGDQDLGPPCVPPVMVVGLDEQQARKLPVGAGGGLEGHGVHAGDLLQQVRRLAVDRETALDRLLPLEGVDGGEARQGGHVLVDLGVVLHGAGTQGVEPVVDPVDLLGQGGVVAGHLRLRYLRQLQFGLPGVGQGDFRHVTAGQ